MEHTPEEVCQRALRMIGVVASDEAPTADQMDAAKDILSSVWAETLGEAQASWDIVTGTPMEAFVPLAHLLAAELAGEYGVPSPMTRPRAKLRLLAVVRPMDRANALNGDSHSDYGAGARVVYLGQLPGPNWNDKGTW